MQRRERSRGGHGRPQLRHTLSLGTSSGGGGGGGSAASTGGVGVADRLRKLDELGKHPAAATRQALNVPGRVCCHLEATCLMQAMVWW